MINVQVDTKAFDKALDEYMKFTKKSVADVINAKAYYIARNAVLFTHKASASKIETDLNESSRDFPDVPLAAIIINSRLKKQGKKGLSGRKMAQAVKKMINARKKAVNFLRSGWLPAIRILETFMKRGDSNNLKYVRRYAPKTDSTVKQYGQDKGTAIWAKPHLERTFTVIENAVQGGKDSNKNGNVHNFIVSGLEKGVKAEIASMRLYVERKMNPEIDKFNR